MRGDWRRLKEAFFSSGERIANGRTTELRNVMRENITSERLPILPTSPRVSDDSSAADSGA